MRRSREVLSVFWALPLFFGGLAAHGQKAYDEVFDDKGRVRAHYEKVYAEYKRLSEADKKKFLEGSRKDFLGDNALNPMPRVLTESEYDTLKRGVEQRGKALRMFLEDHYSGKKSYRSVIPDDVMKRILDRAGDTDWQGLVDPKNISFPYGPDIIRDEKGLWRVIEDNPGYIGGPGDLAKAREIMLQRMPGYKAALEIRDDPMDYYRDLAQRYRTLAAPKDGKVVMYQVPPYPDMEDSRISKIFHDLGVEIITPNTAKKLVTRADGVYLERKGPDGKLVSKERVGFVSVNGEHWHVDWSHALTRQRALVDEAHTHLEQDALDPKVRARIENALKPDAKTGKMDYRKIELALNGSNYQNGILTDGKKLSQGLVQAILDGKVASNYTPGVDFIGDKEFYIYADDLVRHYLKEEPILKNIETGSFSKTDEHGKLVADEHKIDEVLKHPEKHVVKVVDGRGGDGVWVGPKISKQEFLALKPRLLKEHDRIKWQRYTALSTQEGYIVDLRMVSFVDPHGVYVSPTPWGRSLPIKGDGKVNLSATGTESAVIVVADPQGGGPCGLPLRRLLHASP